MANEYTPEMLAQLEAQVAYFRSDDLLRERASVWRDASPSECLLAVFESCAEAAVFLHAMAPDIRERALAPDPLPESTRVLLESLWTSRH